MQSDASNGSGSHCCLKGQCGGVHHAILLPGHGSPHIVPLSGTTPALAIGRSLEPVKELQPH